MKPNAPNRDEPARTPPPLADVHTYAAHHRSESYKSALVEGLLQRGKAADLELLCISRLEKKPWFRPRRFFGFAALIRAPGDWIMEGRGPTPEAALLEAVNAPLDFPFLSKPKSKSK